MTIYHFDIMAWKLYDYQRDAIGRIKNGSILCGGVGSGKSLTALAYYYIFIGGGQIEPEPRKMRTGVPLYIITTAKKRDSLEWDEECSMLGIQAQTKVHIDSWNNIDKYLAISDAFFIFDEQRVVGYGAWSKNFISIAKYNRWILLSATPGDTWSDYIPVFIANGFYKNKSDFTKQHIVYSRFTKYPKIDHYINCDKLVKERQDILVYMQYTTSATIHKINVPVSYNVDVYNIVYQERWDVFSNKPLQDAAGVCYALRRVVNSDSTRISETARLLEKIPKCIIFYNFDYELCLLREMCTVRRVMCAEWNGHKHEPVPNGDQWVYLVQYNAGAEGWNCVQTDSTIFFSQNYSYKMMKQAAGRIDRANTPFTDLYYYYLRSNAPIDASISRALARKQNFNETKYCETIFSLSQEFHAL